MIDAEAHVLVRGVGVIERRVGRRCT
jgi:hypothetical protein